jgi:CheY-like chemotaxis protein
VPHYLVASDADWILDEVMAALGGPGVSFTVCRTGKQVVPSVRERTPDLAVLDLQSGNMGAIAVTMALHLEESGGRLPHVPVLILLDRVADLFLAKRSGAEGWLVKPLDSLRLRRAAATIAGGGHVYEGVPVDAVPVRAAADATLNAAEGEAAAATGDSAGAAGSAASASSELAGEGTVATG